MPKAIKVKTPLNTLVNRALLKWADSMLVESKGADEARFVAQYVALEKFLREKTPAPKTKAEVEGLIVQYMRDAVASSVTT
jgi:hypothetical protein